MTKAALALCAIAVVLVIGCGRSDRELDEIRAEQQQGFERMRDQLTALNDEVGRLRRDLAELDSELFELKGRIEFGLLAERGPEGSGPAATRTGASRERSSLDATPIQPLDAQTLQELAEAVAELQDQLIALREEFVTQREVEELRDPRRTWEAMNDPEQLSRRLDRFARVWAETIDDDVTRREFVADVNEIRADIEARANLSEAELVAQYRAKLNERISTETNQRMRQWYQHQLRALESTDKRAVDTQIQTFQRYDTAAALKELSEKYKITNEQLRSNGLQSYGGAYGWR